MPDDNTTTSLPLKTDTTILLRPNFGVLFNQDGTTDLIDPEGQEGTYGSDGLELTLSFTDLDGTRKASRKVNLPPSEEDEDIVPLSCPTFIFSSQNGGVCFHPDGRTEQVASKYKDDVPTDPMVISLSFKTDTDIVTLSQDITDLRGRTLLDRLENTISIWPSAILRSGRPGSKWVQCRSMLLFRIGSQVDDASVDAVKRFAALFADPSGTRTITMTSRWQHQAKRDLIEELGSLQTEGEFRVDIVNLPLIGGYERDGGDTVRVHEYISDTRIDIPQHVYDELMDDGDDGKE